MSSEINKEPIPSTDWEIEFERIVSNPIYFIEAYWNKLNETCPVELSKEEKQKFFDKHKGIPLLSMDNFIEYREAEKKRRESGIEDWEVLIK